MTTVLVRPRQIRSFGQAEDATFCLVTNPRLSEAFEIDGSGYRRVSRCTLAEDRTLADVLVTDVPEPAHVLVISPDRLVVSPDPTLVGRRKLISLACNSTPTTIDAIAHFLRVLEQTDPRAQEEHAERVFAAFGSARHLELLDDEHGTVAVFQHLSSEYCWNQQAGVLQWGEQQIAPPGELSVLPVDIMEYDVSRRFALDGEIALSGRPILHAGAASYTCGDQARIHARLSALELAAVVATVVGGVVAAVRPTKDEAEGAVRTLEDLFAVDSRYRVVWELGFGINEALDLYPGNAGMNEPFGGTHGVFHLGLGLTPHTQYAPIFLCPSTRVRTSEGIDVVGCPPKRRTIVRHDRPCGCLEGGAAQVDRSGSLTERRTS